MQNSTRAAAEDRTSSSVLGYVATAGVVATCLLLFDTWHGGVSQHALLAGAALGLLCRTPYRVAIWAGLTVLVATVVALVGNNEVVAEHLASYSYYGLAVGCLWAIWNLVAERFCWNMPATTLFEAVIRRGYFTTMPLRRAAFIAVLVVISATVAKVSEPGAIPLVVIAYWGFARRPRFLFILCCAATLLALANLFFLVGNRALAVRADLLAAEAFGVALVWLGWRAIGKLFASRSRTRRGSDVGSVDGMDDIPSQSQASDEKVASV